MDEGDRPASDEDSDRRAEPVEEGYGETAKGNGDDPVSRGTDGTADRDSDESVDEAARRDDKTAISADESAVDAVDSAEGSVEWTELNGNQESPGDNRDDIPSEGAIGGDKSLVYQFRHDNDGTLMWVREMLSSVAIVLVLGLILFGVSGVWPPMVAVESGSMEPNMEVGDLVFITEPGRFAPDAATNDIGVVTHEEGSAAEYQTFGSYGSVVIFQPPGRTASPIIHRAMFHVEEGEDWYDQADDRYHNAANCDDLRHCPAPHDGFITLGDNNGEYDQANGLAEPVKADWVTGVARLRVPYLGYVRLIATGQAELGDVLAMSVETNGYFTSEPSGPDPVADRGPSSSGTETRGVFA